MQNLDKASNPALSPREFKELLDLEDVDVYVALDLNESASGRYIDYLETQPDIEYQPSAEDFDGQTLQKANAGDHLAQFLMAVRCHEQGDMAGEAEWFRKSAENGNIIAAFNYAVTLSNQSEQLPWFYRAAYKGISEAQREVGRILYEQGDLVTAEKWFGLAIRRGNTMALNDMGIIHWRKSESEIARDFWQRAADAGDQDAISNLEMASSEASIFDDDFDFVGDGNSYTPPQSSYQQQPVRVVESTKRSSFEIL
jgi:tetratricopeptide (TPR) repeat protein